MLLIKLLAAYLLGSISGSLLLGRVRGVDIRTLGSGNAGGTNALRTQGWRFAAGVMLIDVGKGAAAAWIGLQPWGDAPLSIYAQGLACAFAATLGHVWPVFFGFRGGKGVATVLGAVLVLLPQIVPALLGIWLVVLLASGYVGLASVCAAVCLVPAVWWVAAAEARDVSLLFASAVALLIVFTHRSNLARLMTGTEARFERARLLARLWRRT